MNRREVLKRLALGIPAGLFLPHLFSSCKDKELLSGVNYTGKVVVVGAGAAGLYAAYLLHKRGADVTILEAGSVYGGRVRPLTGFSDFTVELGAEEIHGQRTVWYDLVRNSGAQFADDDGQEDYIHLDGELKAMSDAEADTDLKKITAIADEPGNYSGGDITTEQYLLQQGVPQRVMHYGNAVLGNEFGTSADRISMKGIADGDKAWTAGNRNILVRDKSFLSILESVVEPILSKVRLNTQVVTISSGNQLTLTDQNGTTYTADKVIIAVPLTVLRDGDITFSPPLSASRTNAFSRIGMGAGMKVILQFTNRFWPDKTGSIYSDGVVPEYWATGEGGRSTAKNLLTAFVHGAKAEYLIAQGNNLVNLIVQDLDNLFGAGVASGALQNSVVMNWTAEPFIRGTYSYPVPGGDGAREEIAKPINNNIFFAGEATHTAGHFGTLHGALETGFRAAAELLNTVAE
jgi:monoamine oxidase